MSSPPSFAASTNRMINGYLLRDVINKVSGIHFTSTEEIQPSATSTSPCCGRCATRRATPANSTRRGRRAVHGDGVDPRLGETVLDPACGTGGFLVEAFTHLESRARPSRIAAAAERERLRRRGQAAAVPAGADEPAAARAGCPQIDPGNALRFRLGEIGDHDRVDVILTNPPFGGEEEKGIQGNFPEDKRPRDGAAVPPAHHAQAAPPAEAGPRRRSSCRTARFSATASAARIKEELLSEFNLHTIVRLPNGVFAPYTSIPTNILFFDRSGPTQRGLVLRAAAAGGAEEVHQDAAHAVRGVRGLPGMVGQREENEHAWRVPAETMLADGCNLDLKNPRAKEDMTHLPPEELVASILEKERRIAEIMMEAQALLAGERRGRIPDV